jgi:small subunit ribosomal protein S13
MLSVFVKWSQQRKKVSETVLCDYPGVSLQGASRALSVFGVQKNCPLGRLPQFVKDRVSANILESDPFLSPVGNDVSEKVRRQKSFQVSIRTYRGLRYHLKLPVRGQRTKTNSRTVKSSRPKSLVPRTSYRQKGNRKYLGNTQIKKKMSSDPSKYSLPKKKRSRSRVQFKDRLSFDLDSQTTQFRKQ